MLQRLVYLAMASTAVLAGITLILRYFSDILPLATTEPQSAWRFEAAFLLTAAQWIAIAVAVLAAASVVIALMRSGRTGTP
jgi:lipopolysaccharide export LptBFGC system permease protein LptF